ncbi:YlzJ-like protein [Syntrophomonas zehnderi OL-4]|uniref:YlzJ-like protein n=1 Tax=Syntrophomonas zehnderi OL-4 TaxID=690567 RepID=A0A0E3W3E3_9FIRM|nr:YlzJ-like family protein [Syntrophomonas zehnderi]CFX75891.1 YlzJ-like protein [Syntrophomonas zehnderi OL-4]
MIYYSPVPLELIQSTDPAKIISIPIPSGGYIRAEAVDYNRIRVLELVSTDPMDYLDEGLQPGRIVSLKPSL